MNKVAKWMLCAAAVAGLVSCGECACKANHDYLRDVPVTQSRQFQ